MQFLSNNQLENVDWIGIDDHTPLWSSTDKTIICKDGFTKEKSCELIQKINGGT